MMMIRRLYNGLARMFGRLRRDRKGAALVEYSLLIAGVALISMAAISILGHKTSDLVGTVAAILPGAHTDDNHPIQSGHLIETVTNSAGAIVVDSTTIINSHSGKSRLDGNVFGDSTNSIIVTETTF
jgi:pilus assembly protein Flp/PilA